MTPQHLLALCAITCTVTVQALIIKPYHRPIQHKNTNAPEFWWDLTLDHDAPISDMLLAPMSPQYMDNLPKEDVESREHHWQLEWAYGTSTQWLPGGYGFWSAWAWNSTFDSDSVTGGGFIYNETKSGIVAGVNWMKEPGVITWNCFMEGDVTGQLAWSEWELIMDDGSTIGFRTKGWKWGFTIGDIKVVSKHCGTGSPVVGKRYMYDYHNRKEIASSVERDPFQHAVRPRHKRSPDFFEKVSQTVKEWFQKVKNFFTGGNQQDGSNPEARDGEKKCNTFVDLMVKIIDFILGRRRNGGGGGGSDDRPNMPQPPGGVPQGPNGEIPDNGGDPPGGADEPPADAEEIDTAQNDAIRDWE